MRVFSTNDKVLLQKKNIAPPTPQKTSIVTPKLLPKNNNCYLQHDKWNKRKGENYDEMKNDKKKNKKQKEASSTTFK